MRLHLGRSSTPREAHEYVDGERDADRAVPRSIDRAVLLRGHAGGAARARTVAGPGQRKVTRVSDLLEYAAHQTGRFSARHLGHTVVSIQPPGPEDWPRTQP